MLGSVGIGRYPRFVRTPPAMRKKVDKSGWEWSAELSALVVNTMKEARAQMPVDEAVLRQEFLEKFVMHLFSICRPYVRFLRLSFFPSGLNLPTCFPYFLLAAQSGSVGISGIGGIGSVGIGRYPRSCQLSPYGCPACPSSPRPTPPLNVPIAPRAQVDGDSTIELELSSALREKSPNFHIRHLGRLAVILDAHHNQCPIPSAATTDIGHIQADAFDLTMRQMDYDCQAFRVWQGKLKNYDSAPLPPSDFQRLRPPVCSVSKPPAASSNALPSTQCPLPSPCFAGHLPRQADLDVGGQEAESPGC